jgi:hypothetical protein
MSRRTRDAPVPRYTPAQERRVSTIRSCLAEAALLEREASRLDVPAPARAAWRRDAGAIGRSAHRQMVDLPR